MKRCMLSLAMIAALLFCLAVPALAVTADPLPPVQNAADQLSEIALALIASLTGGNAPAAEESTPAAEEKSASAEASGEPSSDEPSEEPAAALIPGRYEGSDGSVLQVEEDGSCTYETTVSGKVNGKAMSGRLTFHGKVDGGVFSFDKVTFFGLDLTDTAAALGYTDASDWEQAAGIIYAGGVNGTDAAPHAP